MPVGHIWKFDLEKAFNLDFGVKCNVSKIRIEHVMLKFLATTQNTRSKAWSDTEMKYRAPEAEMFAVVTYVEKYKAYLGSEPFKL